MMTPNPTLNPQSGSYANDDVTLLLDIVDKDSIAHVPVHQKEALIQSGQQHYSDMLTLEQPPSAVHEQLFEQALHQGSQRMAADIGSLALSLYQIFQDQVSSLAPLIIISLVRAGLPIGVLLQRALTDRDSAYPAVLPSLHYGVSIIRDRGLDPVALQLILTQHPTSPIIFVDGWSGKGAIYKELERSLTQFSDPCHPYHGNIFHQYQNSGECTTPLVTLSDPAGVAWLSASTDDWLIPSGLLGCTVSGLISRSLFTAPTADLRQGLHRSVLYHELIPFDHSMDFVSTIDSARRQLILATHSGSAAKPSSPKPADARSTIRSLPQYPKPRYSTQPIIEKLQSWYDICNQNRIKPTIAEATRALLRRDPERVLLAYPDHPDTALLRHLCKQKRIKTDVIGQAILPYQAVTIIKKRN